MGADYSANKPAESGIVVQPRLAAKYTALACLLLVMSHALNLSGISTDTLLVYYSAHNICPFLIDQHRRKQIVAMNIEYGIFAH